MNPQEIAAAKRVHESPRLNQAAQMALQHTDTYNIHTHTHTRIYIYTYICIYIYISVCVCVFVCVCVRVFDTTEMGLVVSTAI